MAALLALCLSTPLYAQAEQTALWDFHTLPLGEDGRTVDRAIGAMGWRTREVFLNGDLTYVASVNAPGPRGPNMQRVMSLLNVLTDDAGRTITVGYLLDARQSSLTAAQQAAGFVRDRITAALGAGATTQESSGPVTTWSKGDLRVLMYERESGQVHHFVYFAAAGGAPPEPVRFTVDSLISMAVRPTPGGRPRWVRGENVQIDTAHVVRAGRYRIGWVQLDWKGNENGVKFDAIWKGNIYDCSARRFYNFSSVRLLKQKVVAETRGDRAWKTNLLHDSEQGFERFCAAP